MELRRLRLLVLSLLTANSESSEQSPVDIPAVRALPCPRSPTFLQEWWLSPASSYDKHTRPPPLPGGDAMEPTNVFVTLIPLKLGAFNTKRQLMTVELEINLVWADSRIMFNGSCASELTKPTAFNETVEGEWLPEIWTSPEQAGLCLERWRSTRQPADYLLICHSRFGPHRSGEPHFTFDNVSPSGADTSISLRSPRFRVNNDGGIWAIFRASVDLKCSMDFTDMPRDVQTCPVTFMSLEMSSRVQILSQVQGRANVNNANIRKFVHESKQVLSDMSNTEWECRKLSEEVGAGLNRMLDIDKSYLVLRVELARKSRVYEQEVIVPTMMLVAIAWASFFIARAAVPARVAMCAHFIAQSSTRHLCLSSPILLSPCVQDHHLLPHRSKFDRFGQGGHPKGHRGMVARLPRVQPLLRLLQHHRIRARQLADANRDTDRGGRREGSKGGGNDLYGDWRSARRGARRRERS